MQSNDTGCILISEGESQEIESYYLKKHGLTIKPDSSLATDGLPRKGSLSVVSQVILVVFIRKLKIL